jgi:hypothetical protein
MEMRMRAARVTGVGGIGRFCCMAVGYWADGVREAGRWHWAGGVEVGWIHLWAESKVCY